MKLRVLITVAGLLVLAACKDEEPPAPAKQVEEAAPQEAEEPRDPLLSLRQAFGLPIPPEVVHVRQTDQLVHVETKLKIAEVREFFESRLVDFEFIDHGPYRFEAVGLRSGMPSIFVTYRRASLPTVVRYQAAPPPKKSVEERAEIARKTREAREKGKPVTETMPDGTPMAPGAVWGKPYTPPPGSPLDQPRYRANFGKPWGTWVPN